MRVSTCELRPDGALDGQQRTSTPEGLIVLAVFNAEATILGVRVTLPRLIELIERHITVRQARGERVGIVTTRLLTDAESWGWRRVAADRIPAHDAYLAYRGQLTSEEIAITRRVPEALVAMRVAEIVADVHAENEDGGGASGPGLYRQAAAEQMKAWLRASIA